MEYIMHTPEGFRDIFGMECDKKRYLARTIERKFRSFGYQPIETTSFEFSDVFSREVGSVPEQQFYRFFDRDGNILVLRPDFTPSVARAVATYFKDEQGPLRLCYSGSVFRNNSALQGRLRENTQSGVEFLNEDSAEADAEILSLVVKSLLSAGLSDFQISLGHADYFQAIAKEAMLDEETGNELSRLLSIQNRYGAESLIEGLHLRKDLKEAFRAIPELFGGPEVLERAEKLTDNKQALAAIRRLKRIHTLLEAYGADGYVNYDLGMLTEYQYYTGIIFRCYTYGTGDAIVKGGRYNRLLNHFHKESAAVGFTVEIDELLSAMERQNIVLPLKNIKTMLLYPANLEEKMISLAEDYRAQGMPAACIRFEDGKVLEDYRRYGLRNQFGGIVYYKAEHEAYAIDLMTNEVSRIEGV